MKSSRAWLERLTANAEVALNKVHIKNQKNPPVKFSVWGISFNIILYEVYSSLAKTCGVELSC
jgi:hypothetical protein